MAQFADDLAALLDALGIGEPVVLCGLSMGGYIAFQFWRRHAARLRALILCDTRAAADGPEAAAARHVMAERVLREGPARWSRRCCRGCSAILPAGNARSWWSRCGA